LNSESGVKVNLASGYAMERVDIEDLYFEDYCHAYQGKPFTGIGERGFREWRDDQRNRVQRRDAAWYD
jgi:hypothetical protein